MAPMGKFPERPTVISVLRSSTLLNPVAEEHLQRVVNGSHLAFAERGETIWVHGSHVGFVGIVGTGFVKMVRSTGSTGDLTHEIMGPGQVFGLLGAISGEGCPSMARSVSHCWYLKVPKEFFNDIYQRTPRLKSNLVVRTTTRLRKAQEMIAHLSTGTVENRIAAVLIMLAESYAQETPEGKKLDVPLTRQDIAEMAGTTVESTIRVMSRWQKDGLLRTDSRQVVILNEERIEAMLRT